MDMDIFSTDDTAPLDDAVDIGEEFADKYRAFVSGLIDPSLRYYQLQAHKMYDACTERQREVLLLRLKHHTFKEIAMQLQVQESTIKVHWYRLLRKLSSFID